MFNKAIFGLLVFWLVGCAPAIHKAAPPELNLRASNNDIVVILHHVILPDGPGSWTSQAPWREYVISVRSMAEYSVFLEKIFFLASSPSKSEFQGVFLGPMPPMEYYPADGWERYNKEFYRRVFPRTPRWLDRNIGLKRSLFFPASFPPPEEIVMEYSLIKEHFSSRERRIEVGHRIRLRLPREEQ